MRRVHQAGALVSLAFSLWVVQESRQYNYYTSLGPGPGFFPFWLGVSLGVLSAIWLGQVTLQRLQPSEEGFLPDRGGVLRVVSIVVAVAIFGLFVNSVGFSLMMFLFLFFLLVALGRVNWLLTLAISLVGSFGLYYIFKNWLDVQLPPASIEILKNLGF